MEAVPRLPMLSFDLKVSPDNGDFADRIRILIRERYGENPQNFQSEVSELEALRANACIRPSLDTSGTDTIKKYYCQLHFLKKRFNIEDGMFNFTWNDCYLGVACNFTDWEYEMASVLYNAGAHHSMLGSRERRESSEEMKVACTHFQCAAWVFHTLPDRYPKQMGSDLSVDVLAFLSQVCLAQAQECILEKSILDHRKSTIIAKVCVQVAEYYKAAYKKIETSNSRNEEEPINESVGERKNKLWTKWTEFKMTYYTAVSYFFMGVQAEDDQQMGLRQAYFQAASDYLNSVAKLGKNFDAKDRSLLASVLSFVSDIINGKLDNAKKENEFVFHEKVPDFDSLPELKGASLVKGLGFDVTNSSISGPDLFSRLVPMAAHEASSMYSEEKAKLLRSIGDEIAFKDETLATFMTTLHLDEIPLPGDEVALPQELIECAAGISVKGDAIKQLKDAMGKIASVSADVESSLREAKEILKNEDEEEKSYQAICGKRPNPLSPELELELKKYEDAHQMASESNMTLHNAIELHLENLTQLSRPLEELQKEIPSMADLDEQSEARIAEVRRLIAKVDEMQRQRVHLAESLRKDIHNDDITKKLIVAEDSEKIQEVFDTELKKFDEQIKVLRLNLLAQDNILRALTESNAEFAETRRNVAELLAARKSQIDQYVASFHAYEDLLVKAAKGLEFYDKLGTNVDKLLSRIKGVAQVQQEERDAKIAAKAKDSPMFHASSMMGSGTSAASAGYPSYSPIPPKPERLTLRQVLEERKMAQNLAVSSSSVILPQSSLVPSASSTSNSTPMASAPSLQSPTKQTPSQVPPVTSLPLQPQAPASVASSQGYGPFSHTIQSAKPTPPPPGPQGGFQPQSQPSLQQYHPSYGYQPNPYTPISAPVSSTHQIHGQMHANMQQPFRQQTPQYPPNQMQSTSMMRPVQPMSQANYFPPQSISIASTMTTTSANGTVVHSRPSPVTPFGQPIVPPVSSVSQQPMRYPPTSNPYQAYGQYSHPPNGSFSHYNPALGQRNAMPQPQSVANSQYNNYPSYQQGANQNGYHQQRGSAPQLHQAVTPGTPVSSQAMAVGQQQFGAQYTMPHKQVPQQPQPQPQQQFGVQYTMPHKQVPQQPQPQQQFGPQYTMTPQHQPQYPQQQQQQQHQYQQYYRHPTLASAYPSSQGTGSNMTSIVSAAPSSYGAPGYSPCNSQFQHPQQAQAAQQYHQPQQAQQPQMHPHPVPTQAPLPGKAPPVPQSPSFPTVQEPRPVAPLPKSVAASVHVERPIVPQPMGSVAKPQPVALPPATEDQRSHSRQSSVDILSTLDQQSFNKPEEVLKPMVLTGVEIKEQKKVEVKEENDETLIEEKEQANVKVEEAKKVEVVEEKPAVITTVQSEVMKPIDTIDGGRPGSALSTSSSKMADLSLNDSPSGKKVNKITKQDFANPAKLREKRDNEANKDDPLSQLDPFWSLK